MLKSGGLLGASVAKSSEDGAQVLLPTTFTNIFPLSLCKCYNLPARFLGTGSVDGFIQHALRVDLLALP